MTDNDSALPPNPDNAPDDPERRRVLTGIAAVGIGLALTGCKTEQSTASGTAPRSAADLRLDAALHDQVKQIVVIYAENRSFANLYGNFPGVQYPLEAVRAARTCSSTATARRRCRACRQSGAASCRKRRKWTASAT